MTPAESLRYVDDDGASVLSPLYSLQIAGFQKLDPDGGSSIYSLDLIEPELSMAPISGVEQAHNTGVGSFLFPPEVYLVESGRDNWCTADVAPFE